MNVPDASWRITARDLTLASQRSDNLGRSERAEERQVPSHAAPAPAPAALDVERLAEAITKAIPVGYPIRDYVRAAADGIAREYARAATRPAEDADHD